MKENLIALGPKRWGEKEQKALRGCRNYKNSARPGCCIGEPRIFKLSRDRVKKCRAGYGNKKECAHHSVSAGSPLVAYHRSAEAGREPADNKQRLAGGYTQQSKYRGD